MADNALTAKVAGLPTWGWLLVAGGGGFLVYRYEKRRSSTSAAASSIPSAAAGSPTGTTVAGGSIISPPAVTQGTTQLPSGATLVSAQGGQVVLPALPTNNSVPVQNYGTLQQPVAITGGQA